MRRASPDSSRPTVTRFHRVCCAVSSSAVTIAAPAAPASPAARRARSADAATRCVACPSAATRHCRARRARQRRCPLRRPIKPRIPSLHCGGPRAQLARIAPYASPFPRMRAISPLPGSIFASCMLFGVKMARSSLHVSISWCDRAVLDAWRGNLAVKGGFSRRGV